MQKLGENKRFSFASVTFGGRVQFWELWSHDDEFKQEEQQQRPLQGFRHSRLHHKRSDNISSRRLVCAAVTGSGVPTRTLASQLCEQQQCGLTFGSTEVADVVVSWTRPPWLVWVCGVWGCGLTLDSASFVVVVVLLSLQQCDEWDTVSNACNQVLWFQSVHSSSTTEGIQKVFSRTSVCQGQCCLSLVTN